MDEHGIAQKVCRNSQVLADLPKKCTFIKTSENQKWVSVLETVSAIGRYIWPVIVFKGKAVQNTWFGASEIPDWLYIASKNSWIPNEISLRWIQSVFIPETAAAQGQTRILLLDGHGSYITTKFMYTCRTHNIQLVYLPPHLSHVL